MNHKQKSSAVWSLGAFTSVQQLRISQIFHIYTVLQDGKYSNIIYSDLNVILPNSIVTMKTKKWEGAWKLHWMAKQYPERHINVTTRKLCP